MGDHSTLRIKDHTSANQRHHKIDTQITQQGHLLALETEQDQDTLPRALAKQSHHKQPIHGATTTTRSTNIPSRLPSSPSSPPPSQPPHRPIPVVLVLFQHHLIQRRHLLLPYPPPQTTITKPLALVVAPLDVWIPHPGQGPCSRYRVSTATTAAAARIPPLPLPGRRRQGPPPPPSPRSYPSLPPAGTP